MAIDQDPYFRMARDFADRMKNQGYLKPAAIHTKFLVSLNGVNSKMSSTGVNINNGSIFMTDKSKDIRKKIMRSFSGGGDTLELHRIHGGNLQVDVAYQYLCYFIEDDKKLEEIACEYKSGKMTSGQIKGITADAICALVEKHNNVRSAITDDHVKHFFDRTRFDL